MPAYSTVGDIPDDVDVAIVAVPADAVQDVVLDCAAKGVHGLVVISSGFAETGEEGRQRQRRLVGLSRSYGLRLIGPNCLGIINTDPSVSINASLSSVMPPRGRAGFFCQSGALGSAILEKVQNRGLGLSTFVSAGNRADVSGNDLLQYWEEDDSTEVVLLYLESIGNPRKFSRIARRVACASRSSRSAPGGPPRASRWGTRSARSPRPAGGRRDVPAGRRDPGRHPGGDVRRRPAAGPPAAAAGAPGRDRGQLRRARPARRRRGRRRGLVVNKSVALGAEATAEDFEDALDAAIDDPEVDAVVAVYIPPLNVSGEDVANVLAAVGEQSDKPLVSSFLGAEGVPELLRVPDVAGSTAGRGSVPSYPAVEAAVRALARRGVRRVVAPRRGAGGPGEVDQQAAKRLVTQLLRQSPEGTDLSQADLRACWRRTASTSGDARPDAREAQRAGRDLGWDVVLKATAEHLRERPDQAHVWRNIDTPAEMQDAWQSLTERITDPEKARFVVQKNAPPGVPVAIRSIEDPLFGPVVSFGISGPLIELLADKSYRIPPLGSATPPRWSARSSRRRCCSATAAARSSTSPRSSG